MGFSQDEGYVPETIEEIMEQLMEGVNTQWGTSYVAEDFEGTNFYKFMYVTAQKIQENGVKASEIFQKLQDYIQTTNDQISRPVVTAPGALAALEAEGYVASMKPPIDADAGKAYLCVDVDDTDPDYDDIKLAVNTIIKDSIAAGVITQGTESSAIVLTNGQSFDFKYALPDRQRTYLRLTTVLSVNNQHVIASPDVQKQTLLANVLARYRLGRDFEPQRYFDNVTDAPWAASVLVEWSDDGVAWSSDIFEAEFDDLFEFDLADITLVES